MRNIFTSEPNNQIQNQFTVTIVWKGSFFVEFETLYTTFFYPLHNYISNNKSKP